MGLTLTNPMTILSFASLFAGLGIDPGNVIVGAFRSRMTKTGLGRINVASGIVIGIFALSAIGAAIRG